MAKFTMSLLTGPRGDISSKRAFALLCFIAACISTFVFKDAVSTGIYIGGATAALGIAGITHT
jgi:hypothetical protein